MKKKTLYMWTAVIAAIGIMMAVMLGIYVEEKRSRDAYRKIEDIVPGENELLKYGVDTDIFGYGTAVAGMAGVALIVCGGMLILCHTYVKSRDLEIERMERYCEDILDGKYALGLRENEEGELSLLKNKVHDITVMLNEQNRYLEKNKKDMEKMIADISHQLKTPITSLNMINEILYMDLSEEKKMEFLDNMQKDLMKIEWLVKTILNMAKLDSKTLNLEKKEVNALQFSSEIAEHFKVFCEMNSCEIKTQCKEDVSLSCDRKWTKEAVNNIVKNAIEHGAKMVLLDWEENQLYTKLEIKDDGDGIDEKDIPHIFERFYKTKDSREDSMGLGLSFAKSIIAHQDGEIKIKSKKGKGTTFILKFYKNLP